MSASDDPMNPNKPAILSFSYGGPGMLSREAQQRQSEQVRAAVDRAIGMQTVSGPFVVDVAMN